MGIKEVVQKVRRMKLMKDRKKNIKKQVFFFTIGKRKKDNM